MIERKHGSLQRISDTEGLSAIEVATIKRKKWTQQHGKLPIQMESLLFQNVTFSRNCLKHTLP